MVPSALSATAGATLLSPETAQRAAHTHELRAFDERAGKGPRSQLLDSEVPVWLAFERGLQSTLNDTRTSAHGLLLQSISLEATLSFGLGAFQGRLARLREHTYSAPFFNCSITRRQVAGRWRRLFSGRLSREAVSIIVKDRVAAAGIDPAGFSGHPLRAGLATSAAIVGVSAHKIRTQAGHASDAVLAHYVREGELFVDNAAGVLL